MTEESNSAIEVQRRELNAVLGADEDDELEVLGRAMQYRAGDVLVPRDWLLDRCHDLDIPERVIPSAPTPHSAYKRSQARLVTSNPQTSDTRTDVFWERVPEVSRQLRVDIQLKAGSGNVNHLRASVFYPADVVGEEGGRWVDHELGTFDYDTDSQTITSRKDDDCPEALGDIWDRMKLRAGDLHARMQEHHTGDDLRHMVYLNMILNSPPDWPDIIPLIDQGGMYFVPEGELTDVIDRLAQIFDESNDFKTGGANMAIRTLEVVDSADKREWITERVEQTLEGLVDDVIEEAFERLDEGDDTADEIVETIVDRVEEEGGETANQYNGLLQAKLDVEAILASHATDVEDDEKQELIESAMDGVDL